MKTAWTEQDGSSKEVIAPLSLIVSAFAPVSDVRGVLTPVLRREADDTLLVLVDLGHDHSPRRIVKAFKIGFGPEQINAAIGSFISCEALEYFLPVRTQNRIARHQVPHVSNQ